jgi:hypothetical protein
MKSLTVINSIRGINFSEEDTVAGVTADSGLHSLPGPDYVTFTPDHSLNNSGFLTSDASSSQYSARNEDFPTVEQIPGPDYATFTHHHSLDDSSFIASGVSPSQYSARSEDFPTAQLQVTPSSEDQYFFVGQDPPSPLEGGANTESATSLDVAQFIDFNLFSDAPITPPSVKTPDALPTRRRVPLTPTQPSDSPQHWHEAPNNQREELYCPATGAALFSDYLQTSGSGVHDTPESPRLMPPNVHSSHVSPPSSAFKFSMARGGGTVTYSSPRPLPAFTPAPVEYHDSLPLPEAMFTNQAGAHHDFLPVPVFMPAPGGGHVEYQDCFPQPASTSTNEATIRDVEDILQAPQPMPPSSVWDVHATPPSSTFSFRMAPDGNSVTPNSDSGPFPQSTWSRATRYDIEKYNLAVYGQTWSPQIYCRWGGKCLAILKHSEEAIQEHVKIMHDVNLKGKGRILCLWDGTCEARENGVSPGEMARHIDTTDGHAMSLVASDVMGWAKRANACTLCTAAFPRFDSLQRHSKITHGVVVTKKGKI